MQDRWLLVNGMQQRNLRLDHKRIELSRPMAWSRQFPGTWSSGFRAHVQVESKAGNTFVGEMKIETKTSGVIASVDVEPFKFGEGRADNITVHVARADARM